MCIIEDEFGKDVKGSIVKKIATLSFVLACLLLSFSSQGADVVELPKVIFEIKSANALEKLEQTLMTPESMLKRFRPGGAKIMDKFVDRGQLQFLATKKVLMISKTILVHSIFDVTTISTCKSQSKKGFLVQMDFAGSDGLLTENIEKYEAQICVEEKSSNHLRIQISAKLYKGKDFNGVIGSIVSDMIAAQTSPLIQAITEEVK